MILVISSKKVYAAKRLELEAKIKNLDLKIMDLQDLIACDFKIDIGEFDVLYVRDPYFKGDAKYLPQIISLAKKFEAAGKKVVDSAITQGELGKGKWADYQKLHKAGLPVPQTGQYLDLQLSTLNFPLILKWTYGFKAKNVYLIKNEEQLKKILPLHPKKEWLVQEFINADYEYKVITVGYKALPVVLRFKIKDQGFRTDFSKAEVFSLGAHPGIFEGCQKYPGSSTGLGSGSRLSPLRLRSGRLEQSRKADAFGRDGAIELMLIAERSSRLLKRELAKVDILEAKGQFYILEVNRFPGLKSFEELTKFDVLAEFLRYLQNPPV